MGIGAREYIAQREIFWPEDREAGTRWVRPFQHSPEYVLRLKGRIVGEVYPTPYEESWWARLPLHNAKEFDTIHEAMTYIEAIGALID